MEEATYSPVKRLDTARRGECLGMILLEVDAHACGTAVLRSKHLFTVVTHGLFGCRVVRSLDKVKPNDASGLAAIGAVVRSDLLEVIRRKREMRRARRRKNGRRRSGRSARTGS